MQKRKLGSTDLNLSTVGLGTWAIGGFCKYGWGPQNDKESISTIRDALEKGINWIDTAPIYGLGHSEEIVGKAIKELRDKPIISTKCGLVWDAEGNPSGRLKRESVRSEIELSLRRLKIDIIDLYQIHWPDPEEDIEEAWSTVIDLIKEGKIRYAGVSNFNVKQLERIQLIHPVASLQPPYSMVERGVEEEILDYCSVKNMGVIVWSPMQKGLLTGKFTRERLENLPGGDHRRDPKAAPHFQEPEFSANLELVEGLRVVAEDRGITLPQLAIAWVLRRSEVTAAIVGARHPFQIEETIGAAELTLSKEDIAAIDILLKKRHKMLDSS